ALIIYEFEIIIGGNFCTETRKDGDLLIALRPGKSPDTAQSIELKSSLVSPIIRSIFWLYSHS
ncbi:hypothetical protein ACJX0J_026423, partial [Zea mays]